MKTTIVAAVAALLILPTLADAQVTTRIVSPAQVATIVGAPEAPEITQRISTIKEKRQRVQWIPQVIEEEVDVPVITTTQRLTSAPLQTIVPRVQVGCVDCGCVQSSTVRVTPRRTTIQTTDCVDCQPSTRVTTSNVRAPFVNVQSSTVDCPDCVRGFGGADVGVTNVQVGRQRGGLFSRCRLFRR